MAVTVKSAGGGGGKPYTGDNPLTIGQEGYTFPAKTLLKDGLQIINGVNGEDLTDTAADQTTAVEDLLKMVNRKIAMNNGEGQYVWKKLTAEGGDFVDFVVSADTGAYPNGGTQDGYWYELVEEGASAEGFGYSKMDVVSFTPSSDTKVVGYTINHSLQEVPKLTIVYAAGKLSKYYALATFILNSDWTLSAITGNNKTYGAMINSYPDKTSASASVVMAKMLSRYTDHITFGDGINESTIFASGVEYVCAVFA